MTKLCPSAQPGMDRCSILGVVEHDGPVPTVAYLTQTVPATEETLAFAAPLKPTEVFRLSATCAEHQCPHFDGADCRLATRVVSLMPPHVDSLPPCAIRKECRWYSQEGRAACLRCPGITTMSYDITPLAQTVSGLRVITDS